MTSHIYKCKSMNVFKVEQLIKFNMFTSYITFNYKYIY